MARPRAAARLSLNCCSTRLISVRPTAGAGSSAAAPAQLCDLALGQGHRQLSRGGWARVVRIPGWPESRAVSPSALSSGMLIVVEEMVLLAARPVVLATIRDAAPCLTSAAAPASSRRCLCEPVEVSYLENSVSIDTFSCSLLLRPLPKAACAVADGPASRMPELTWRHTTTNQRPVIRWV